MNRSKATRVLCPAIRHTHTNRVETSLCNKYAIGDWSGACSREHQEQCERYAQGQFSAYGDMFSERRSQPALIAVLAEARLNIGSEVFDNMTFEAVNRTKAYREAAAAAVAKASQQVKDQAATEASLTLKRKAKAALQEANQRRKAEEVGSTSNSQEEEAPQLPSTRQVGAPSLRPHAPHPFPPHPTGNAPSTSTGLTSALAGAKI